MFPPLATFLVLSAACFGATVGSFLNVCIYRMPREGLSVRRPARSFCPTCGERILWYDNVPILSWLLLGGRCRACRAPISVRYLVVEALTAALFALVVLRYVAEDQGSWGGCLVFLVLVSALVVAAFVDIDLRLIPDEITLTGMHVVPFAVLLFPDLHTRATDPWLRGALTGAHALFAAAHDALPAAIAGAPPAIVAALVSVPAVLAFFAASSLYRLYRRKFLPDLPRRLRDRSLAGTVAALVTGLVAAQILGPQLTWSAPVYALWASLVGMGAGSGLVFAVGALGTRVFRKPAMGFGDVKLMGLLGAVVGWKGALFGFFLACLLGSAVGVVRLWLCRDRYLPFGPFLSVGCVLLALWPEAFEAALEWYLDLFR